MGRTFRKANFDNFNIFGFGPPVSLLFLLIKLDCHTRCQLASALTNRQRTLLLEKNFGWGSSAGNLPGDKMGYVVQQLLALVQLPNSNVAALCSCYTPLLYNTIKHTCGEKMIRGMAPAERVIFE